MKKTLFIMLSVVMVCFCSASLTLAADITLGDTDTTYGTGPGITAISLSNAVKVSYTGAITAGGYGGAHVGEQWAVTTGSTKAKSDMALEFIMRGSEGSEDNNLYQHLNANISAGVTAPTFDPSSTDGWVVRGGSSSSSSS